METFGAALRELRRQRGWRQQDLVEALGSHVARSTIANVETGREPPTPRLWELLRALEPSVVTQLEPLYEQARGRLVRKTPSPPAVDAHCSGDEAPRRGLAGPYVIELLQLIYVFRHSRSPEEIIEVRRVRATRHGADGYGLKFVQTRQEGFRADEEPLWGGHLTDGEHIDAAGRTVYLRRVDFGRRLRKGQVHEFAVRSWVERDPDPETSVNVLFSIPCQAVTIHLNFRGPDTPACCWAFGPIPDEILTPAEPEDGRPVTLSAAGTASAYFKNPELGVEYGIAWRW